MKSKLIIAAVVSTLMLCSCGETKVDLRESVTVSQTVSITASEAVETTETEIVSEAMISEKADETESEDPRLGQFSGIAVPAGAKQSH